MKFSTCRTINIAFQEMDHVDCIDVVTFTKILSKKCRNISFAYVVENFFFYLSLIHTIIWTQKAESIDGWMYIMHVV